jgi:hypothetical protein
MYAILYIYGNNINMYKSHLILTKYVEENDNNCNDNYNLDFKNDKTCQFCSCSCDNLYTIHIRSIDVLTKGCYFCNLIMNFKQSDVFKLFIVKTEIPQHEINKITMNNYEKTGTILHPLEIDKNIKRVNISIIKFINTYNENFFDFKFLMTQNSCESIQFTSKDINVFLKSKPIPKPKPKPDQKKINPYDLSFFNLENYKLSKKDMIFIKKQNNKQNTSEIEDIKKSFSIKIKENNHILDLIENLNK